MWFLFHRGFSPHWHLSHYTSPHWRPNYDITSWLLVLKLKKPLCLWTPLCTITHALSPPPTKYHATATSPAILLFVFVVIAVALLVLIVLVGPALDGRIVPRSGVGMRGIHSPPIQFFSGEIKKPQRWRINEHHCFVRFFWFSSNPKNIYHFVELSFYTPE